MSIIYEALKKTQDQRDIKQELPVIEKKSSLARLKSRIIISVFFLILIAAANYPLINKKNPHKNIHTAAIAPRVVVAPTTAVNAIATPIPEVSTPQPIVATAAPHSLKLNGVFLSNNKRVALINDQFYSEGEIIDGMKIISLDAKMVKLQNTNGTLVELKANV